jgi:hypothetical protein
VLLLVDGWLGMCIAGTDLTAWGNTVHSGPSLDFGGEGESKGVWVLFGYWRDGWGFEEERPRSARSPLVRRGEARSARPALVAERTAASMLRWA